MEIKLTYEFVNKFTPDINLYLPFKLFSFTIYFLFSSYFVIYNVAPKTESTILPKNPPNIPTSIMINGGY